jgi:hypothetical protein
MSPIQKPRIVSVDSPLQCDSPAAAEPLLLTPRQAAALLSVSEKTLHRLSTPHGTIPVVPIGKRGVRYRPAALERWIADQEAASLNRQEATQRTA